MYLFNDLQMSLEDYMEPFDGRLDMENRWVRLAEQVPWEELEKTYSWRFGRSGNKATTFRVAFGCLVIRAALGVSDRQTVELVRESPYLQYFLGSRSFSSVPPCSPRSMEAFRRRIARELVLDTVKKLRVIESGK